MKKCLKTSLICVSIVVMFALQGCQLSLTPVQVQKAAAEVNSLNDRLTEYQEQVLIVAQGLADTNLIDPNLVIKAALLDQQINEARAKISILTAALRNVPLTGDDNQDLLNLLQQLNAASAPFNPYAAPTAGVLAIISLVLTAIAKKKSTQAAANKQALTEVIKGAQDFKAEANIEAVKVFKDTQDCAQSAATKEIVGAIKANI